MLIAAVSLYYIDYRAFYPEKDEQQDSVKTKPNKKPNKTQ